MGKITNIQIIESNFTGSSVDENLKLQGETGLGDNSIYLGPFKNESQKKEYESFLGITIGNVLSVIVFKQDLLDYLADAKNEFYTPNQSYKQDISKLYPGLQNKIQSITSDCFYINLKTSVREKKKGSDQIWIFKNPGDPNFDFLYQICLPRMTQLRFYKELSSNQVYLKPVFNDKLNINKPLSCLTLLNSKKTFPLQQIFYGAPGTGKSHRIKKDECNFAKVIRTIFHPDSDYSSFVGTYKPVMVDDTLWAPNLIFKPTSAIILEKPSDFDPKKISYEFKPQAFINAYVEAWKLFSESCSSYTSTLVTGSSKNNEGNENVEVGDEKKSEGIVDESHEIEIKRVLLDVEEINRGNCAQIFGEIFQLLDRNGNGFSEYPIVADSALKEYLNKQFDSLDISDIDCYYGDKYTSPIVEGNTRATDIKEGSVLILPPNLYIWATMNTSDQSLSPMDSAFKRRWDWEYVPVDHEDAKRFHIFIGGKSYNWDDFITAANKKIFGATQSADKQLGNRFCKSDAVIGTVHGIEHYMISTKQFMGKVMFYLWEEVCKDAPEDESVNFMRICEEINDSKKTVASEYFTFQELYEGKKYKSLKENLLKEAILQMFMNYLNVPEEKDINSKNANLISLDALVEFESEETNNSDIAKCELTEILKSEAPKSEESNIEVENVTLGTEAGASQE